MDALTLSKFFDFAGFPNPMVSSKELPYRWFAVARSASLGKMKNKWALFHIYFFFLSYIISFVPFVLGSFFFLFSQKKRTAIKEQEHPRAMEQNISIKTRVFQEAYRLYKGPLKREWSKELQDDTDKASEWMREECVRLSCMLTIPDDLLMLRFSAGLFANPKTMLAICQQWERMALHTIAPEALAGEGRVWTLLLHLMICEPNLEIGIEPMFQDYQSMVFLMGMQECPFIELMYKYDLFKDSPLDIKHEESRVMCPAFLRFDAHFLLTISGRTTLSLITARKCFDSVGYQENSNISYLLSCLKESLAPVYETMFHHFRPCILACMLVSICWACCSRGSVYRKSMAGCLAHLLTFLERLPVQIDLLRAQGAFLEEKHDEYLLKKIVHRTRPLLETIQYFQNDFKDSGYSLRALDALFSARWNAMRAM